MTFRILVTCAGGDLAPQTLRYLSASRRHKVHITAVDNSPSAVGRHFADVFETVPRGEEPEYAEQLADIARRNRVDLVLPCSDEEALAAATNRALFEASGAQLACAPIETLQRMANKGAAYAFLESVGLSTPTYRRVDAADGMERAVRELLDERLDVVVKPAMARGGRDVCVIRGDIIGARPYSGGREVHLDANTFFAEYISRYADKLPVLVMERLFEPTYDLDILAWEGEARRVVPRRRSNPAVPNEGHIIESRPDLLELGRRVAAAYNLSWLYDCDLMFDREGRPHILELNPRPSGSTAVSIAAGMPLLDDLISLAKREVLPPAELPAGRLIVPYFALAPVSG